MSYMFYGCSKLSKLSLSNFNTAKVTNMSYMFYGCSKLSKLNLGSKFNTAKVTNMSYMFYGCSKLSKLSLSNFNTAKVTNMSYMFYGCSNLSTLNLGENFNTTKVTNMSYMFYGCKKLSKLSLSNFNTAKVTNMNYMFYGCSSLVTIDVNPKEWNTAQVTSSTNMFSGCSELRGQDGTMVGTETDKTHAHTDTGGYLTDVNGPSVPVVNYYELGGNVRFYVEESPSEVTKAQEGATVTIEVVTPQGQKLKELKVVTKTGTEVTLADQGDGTYEFTMPGEGVTATTTFGTLHQLTAGSEEVSFYVDNESVDKAVAGEKVVIDIDEPEDQMLEQVTAVPTQGGDELELELQNDGSYMLTMVDGDVTVTATFKEIPHPLALTGEGVHFLVDKVVENGDEVEVQTVAATEALPRTEVTVVVDCPDNQMLDAITAVQTGSETAVALTAEDNGNYTMLMPEAAVTVTATFIELPSTYYSLTGSNVRFLVNGTEVSQAKQGTQVIIEPVMPDDMQFTGIYDYDGESLTVSADGVFFMPDCDVEVNAEIERRHYPLDGKYVDFFIKYENYYKEVTEAPWGSEVYVSCDPLTFDPGMYFAGSYASNPEKIVSLDPDGTLDGVFTMPAQAVTVDAELVAQKVLEIDLSDDSEKDITFEQASHFMQLEGYLVDREEIRTNNSTFPYTNKYYFDLNLNGEADVLMAITVNDADGNGSQTLKRLKAEGDVAVALITPGLPYAYKEIMLHLGGEEATVHNVSFYDGLSNLNTVKSFKDLTVNALLADRILYKDGCWNTLCLPFDVTIAESPLAGDGVTVKTLQSATFENGKLTLKFTPGSLEMMEANKPYIIKWNKPENYKTYDYNDPTAAYSDLVAPLFTDVVISDDDLESVGDNVVSFIGTYMPIEFEEEDPNVLILGADNELFYPAPSLGYCYLNAQRAYFYLLKDSAKKLSSNDGARSIILDFSDEEVTSLMDNRQWITEHRAAATGWYSLDGRKLNSEPKAKGIYIYNGKKIKK